MIPKRRRAGVRIGLGVLALSSAPIFLACEEDTISTSPSTGVEQQALHDDGIFELEGNAVDEAAAGEDWSTALFGGGNSIANTGVAADPGSLSIFTGGGSKDPIDLDKWRYKDGAVPDKDNITNAYAAAYLDPQDQDLLLYFGADRFATSGDSQIGFWFFKNRITTLGNGTFDGRHAVGDLLVLSDFTVGGTIGTIKVFEWVGDGSGTDGNLNLVTSGIPDPQNNVFCLADNVCATISEGPNIASPWDYTPKSGPVKIFAPGAFFEGGINVSELVPGDTCFSSFVSETRASQSPTATLKDFVLHEFNTCEISITKTCDVTSLNPKGSAFLFTASYTATITNDGASALPATTTYTIVDDAGTPNDTSDDDTQHAGPFALAPGASFQVSGTFQTNTNPPKTNVVKVTADVGSSDIEASSPPTECTALPLRASLNVCKTCSTSLVDTGNQLEVRVGVSGNICNNSQDNIDLTVSATDTVVGALALSDTVLSQGECATFSTTYKPSSLPPADGMFTDQVDVSGTNAALPDPVTGSDTASCSMCVSDAACP